jgi:UDP-3-O-[3-hydroxymyristoyl] glucosamine N-acyltransferase
MPAFKVSALAGLCGGMAEGDVEREISSASSLEDATATQVSFVASLKAAETAKRSRAGCLLVPNDFAPIDRSTVVRVSDPRAAFARLLTHLHPARPEEPGVHATAVIAPTAVIGAECHIGPHVRIQAGAQLGDGCTVHAGCDIGRAVIIGEGSLLYPNVTVYHDVRIGRRAILHAGCVVGADGFGFAFSGGRYEKFPQIGSVEIGNDVEIGANTCIDRAALGVTRIGDGVKLDNLVHVGHNCQIGKHVVIAAQAGFSGAVEVGDYAVIGGQVGVGEKATIVPRAIIGGQAGVLSGKTMRITEPVWGTPVQPVKEHLAQLAALSRLPELLNEVKRLKQRIEELEKNQELEKN